MVGTTSIECRAPRLDEWFRVRLGVKRRASTLALRDAGTGALYLVTRDLSQALQPLLIPVCLRTCSNASRPPKAAMFRILSGPTSRFLTLCRRLSLAA